MEFSKKYSHVGYSYLGVPDAWKPIVKKAVIELEKEMWPQWWLPMFAKRWIHWLAMGQSIWHVRCWWAYKLRNKLARGSISDIKDKYAGLRIYMSGTDKMYEIIERAEKECDETCESCRSKDDVQVVDYGWLYNYCKKCRELNRNRKK